MNEQQRRRTWLSLLIPCSIGIAILTTGILWYIFGSHGSNAKVFGIFIMLFGAMLTLASSKKIAMFRKFIRENRIKK